VDVDVVVVVAARWTHLRCSAHGWVQIIKGITRNNFVKFIFASSSQPRTP